MTIVTNVTIVTMNQIETMIQEQKQRQLNKRDGNDAPKGTYVSSCIGNQKRSRTHGTKHM
jgi:hypothetical protein